MNPIQDPGYRPYFKFLTRFVFFAGIILLSLDAASSHASESCAWGHYEDVSPRAGLSRSTAQEQVKAMKRLKERPNPALVEVPPSDDGTEKKFTVCWGFVANCQESRLNGWKVCNAAQVTGGRWACPSAGSCARRSIASPSNALYDLE